MLGQHWVSPGPFGVSESVQCHEHCAAAQSALAVATASNSRPMCFCCSSLGSPATVGTGDDGLFDGHKWCPIGAGEPDTP